MGSLHNLTGGGIAVLRRAMMMATKRNINFVDAIIGHGAEYVTFNVPNIEECELYIDFRRDKYSYNFEPILSVTGGTRLTLMTGNAYVIAVIAGGWLYIRNTHGALSVRNKISVDFKECTVKTNFGDDVYEISQIGKNSSGLDNLKLFAGEDKESHLAVYELKVTNKSTGEIILHLLPCLDANGEPCLYDEISGTYYQNEGTGAFDYE